MDQMEETQLPYDFEDDLTRFITKEDYVTWEHNNQKNDGFLPQYFAVYESESTSDSANLRLAFNYINKESNQEGDQGGYQDPNTMELQSVMSMAFDGNQEKDESIQDPSDFNLEVLKPE